MQASAQTTGQQKSRSGRLVEFGITASEAYLRERLTALIEKLEGWSGSAPSQDDLECRHSSVLVATDVVASKKAYLVSLGSLSPYSPQQGLGRSHNPLPINRNWLPCLIASVIATCCVVSGEASANTAPAEVTRATQKDINLLGGEPPMEPARGTNNPEQLGAEMVGHQVVLPSPVKAECQPGANQHPRQGTQQGSQLSISAPCHKDFFKDHFIELTLLGFVVGILTTFQR